MSAAAPPEVSGRRGGEGVQVRHSNRLVGHRLAAGQAGQAVDAFGPAMAMAESPSGCSSMVEQKPSKLTTRVRFPSPAPISRAAGGSFEIGAHERQRVAMVASCRGQLRNWSARALASGDNSSLLAALTHHGCAATWPALPAPGEVAEWLKAADCKSARASVRWFESSPLHHAALLFKHCTIGNDMAAKGLCGRPAFTKVKGDLPVSAEIR